MRSTGSVTAPIPAWKGPGHRDAGGGLRGVRSMPRGRSNLCPHRRLMGMSFPGAFAEAFTIPATQVLEVPAALADEPGSLAEPLRTPSTRSNGR